MEFFLFMPQMRLSFEQLVERARAAEAAGFVGMSGMDHLAPPLAEDQPMYEAMVTNTWLAAHTERITLGSLVLCDTFRQPSMLAREAVSLDHASGGRYELGIGWGSVPTEFEIYGVGSMEPRVRVTRLKESLEIITALWRGETLHYKGEHFTLKAARQEPRPLGHIPIVIGGSGKKTMELVRTYADWWNLHTGILDKLDDLRDAAGTARPSMQIRIGFVPSEDQREEVTATTQRRFGKTPVIGTAPELVDHFGKLAERGVERVYAWFCDFAPPQTLAAFGEEVIPHLR